MLLPIPWLLLRQPASHPRASGAHAHVAVLALAKMCRCAQAGLPGRAVPGGGGSAGRLLCGAARDAAGGAAAAGGRLCREQGARWACWACCAVAVLTKQVHETLLEELQQRGFDICSAAQSTRGKSRREETRVATAHIHALVAADLPPGALRGSKALRQRLLDFVADTQAHCLALSPPGKPWLSPAQGF